MAKGAHDSSLLSSSKNYYTKVGLKYPFNNHLGTHFIYLVGQKSSSIFFRCFGKPEGVFLPTQYIRSSALEWKLWR